MRKLTITLSAVLALSVSGTVLAQANPPASAPQQPAAGGEPGFFRPSADPRLTAIPVPAPAPAAPASRQATPPTPDMADEVRRVEEARLERIEASMDRIEARNERAVEEANRRLPVIASPMDGTAAIMSPLNGTAPLVSGLGR